MVTRTKSILLDLSLEAIWNFEKQIWDFPDNKMLHITKMATICVYKKKKIWFWLCFDILSDPEKLCLDLYWSHLSFYLIPEKKNRNCFLSTSWKRGDGKSFEKGKSDRKRGEKAKKAAGGDSSRLIPPSGFRPLRQRPAAHFLRPNFPVISPALLFGSKVWPKTGWN